jgi:hypothetical protein
VDYDINKKRSVLKMAKPMLLLDVDGVLLRDKPLLDHVRYNVNAYVAKKLPSVKNPGRVNHILYNTYGHTGRGLFDAFKIDTSDFTEKVYDRALMSHLWEILSGTDFQNDAAEIHSMTENWDVRLFSNAPLIWTSSVATAISDELKVSRTNFYLKPDPRAYVKFPQNRKKVFVDDSIMNLRTANYMHKWTPIHFDPDIIKKDSSEFMSIGSIWELGLFLRSFVN